jgi:hypothetical protein
MFSLIPRRRISLDRSLLYRISWSEWVTIANSVAIIRATWAAEDAEIAANHANPNTGFLDFDSDLFLCSEDEEYINDVQYCFNVRNFCMLKEVNARLIHPNIKKGGREHERLMKLSKKLVDAVHAGIKEIRSTSA